MTNAYNVLVVPGNQPVICVVPGQIEPGNLSRKELMLLESGSCLRRRRDR